MTRYKLSKRLESAAAYVVYDTMADIGCDHGLLSIHLVKTGKVRRAIASDINIGPLARAKSNIAAAGLEPYIETRLGGGLSVLGFNETETCLITGMGGMTIISILGEFPEKTSAFKQLVISPERDAPALRRFLHKIGFAICDEQTVYENGKFYPILDARPGQEPPYTPAGYAFGEKPLTRLDYVSGLFIKYELERLQRAKESIKRNGGNNVELDEYAELCRKSLSLFSHMDKP